MIYEWWEEFQPLLLKSSTQNSMQDNGHHILEHFHCNVCENQDWIGFGHYFALRTLDIILWDII